MLSWNDQGVLSPIIEQDPTGATRSPYKISLLDLYRNFATTSVRKDIFKGFLNYRKTLHEIGGLNGFQWINGSFLQDVEKLENRPPNDIDVVSFMDTQNVINSDSLSEFISRTNVSIKSEYCVDAYYVFMSELSPENLVQVSAYWYSIWSHTRNLIWKGFIQVPLDPEEDQRLLSFIEGGIK